MKKINPSLPKGTRDFGPEVMKKRNYVFNIFRKTFSLFGFNSIETPSLENIEILNGKYGDEGDKLIFRILNSGEFLKKVETIVRDSNSLLIADEGMTGFGRCGDLFASKFSEISPDLMSLSK